MNKKKLEIIKRMLYLENEISKLESKYSINFIEDKEKMFDFLFDKLALEENVVLNIDERKYVIRACLIPLEDIKEELDKYDNSHPKMPELEFVTYLSEKYRVVIDMILERIKDIRKIDKFNSSKSKMTVFAIPSDRAFTISKEKIEEFLSFKPDSKIMEEIKKQSDTISKQITFENQVLSKRKK